VLGRFLFRWRGAIGALAFGVVFWLARLTFGRACWVPSASAQLAIDGLYRQFRCR